MLCFFLIITDVAQSQNSCTISLDPIFGGKQVQLFDERETWDITRGVVVSKCMLYVGLITFYYREKAVHTDSSFYLLDLAHPNSMSFSINNIPNDYDSLTISLVMA